jgi:hypothetical protein
MPILATEQPKRTMGTAEEGFEQLIDLVVETTRRKFPHTEEHHLPPQAFADYYRTAARVMGKRLYYTERINEQLAVLMGVSTFQ